MRKLLVIGFAVGGLAASHAAGAQAGISLGAAVGTSWRDSKLQVSDDRHGLLYLRLGVPLLPYGARGDFLVYDEPGQAYDMAAIASAVMSLNAPLVQPYALVGIGRYGLREAKVNGVSFGAGVRIGGRRGIFVEARHHDPIERTFVSLGLAF
jgi:hypothetical protein